MAEEQQFNEESQQEGQSNLESVRKRHKAELQKEAGKSPEIVDKQKTATQSVLESLDAKIAAAPDAESIQAFLPIRAELLKQLQEENSEEILAARHKRVLDYSNVAAKFLITPTLAALGSWLAINHLVWIGGMVIGSGLYLIAPDFVMKWLNRKSDNSSSEDKSSPSDETEAGENNAIR